MFIETALILPLVIIMVMMSITIVMLFIIKADTDLDLNMEFLTGGEEDTEREYEICMPFGLRVTENFKERRHEADYGRHIQKAWILRDIIED